MIGQKISPVLEEIEATLWEFEYHSAVKPEYTMDGFRGGVKIFMSVMMDKMWELQDKDGISSSARIAMAEKLGNEVRSLVKIYTNIDTHELYEL